MVRKPFQATYRIGVGWGKPRPRWTNRDTPAGPTLIRLVLSVAEAISHNPRFGAGERPRGGGSRTLAAASSGTQHPPGRSAATLAGYLAELHEQRFRAGVALGHDRRGAALVGHLAELQERGRVPSSASTANATSAAVLREGEIDLDRLQCHADNLAA